jgi:hypothetical protein
VLQHVDHDDALDRVRYRNVSGEAELEHRDLVAAGEPLVQAIDAVRIKITDDEPVDPIDDAIREVSQSRPDLKQ